MSMRLAMKASLESSKSDGKAQAAAARKAKKAAKAARKQELAQAALPPPLDHTAGVDAETGAMRTRVAARLEAVLETADLATVSTKSLRKKLEGEEAVDLSGEHKAWFKGLVADLLARKTALAEASGKRPELADGEEDPRHPLLSPEMAAVAGVGRANHFRLVKLLWKYIKAHNLQNPENKNEILCDAALRAVFKKDKVTGFGMSKLLGAHIIKDGELADSPRAAPRKSAPKKKRRDPSDDEDEEDEAEVKPRPKKAKAPAGYRGTPALAAFCGVETNNRFAITKIVWAHVKQHELQKPGDKRWIICDETLKNLFGRDKFIMTDMGKLIGAHFAEV